VRAEVVNIDAFSAHADSRELLSWMRNFQTAPGQIFLTHGEPTAASALQSAISRELGWNSSIAVDLEEVSL
jgi:metallo-beta-lactamase family protein